MNIHNVTSKQDEVTCIHVQQLPISGLPWRQQTRTVDSREPAAVFSVPLRRPRRLPQPYLSPDVHHVLPPPNVVLFSPSLGCESPALPVKAGVYSNFGCQVNQYKSAMPGTVKHSGLYVTFITVQSDCLYLGSTYF